MPTTQIGGLSLLGYDRIGMSYPSRETRTLWKA
jgi:hypothetical protein